MLEGHDDRVIGEVSEPIKLFFKSSNTFPQVTSRTACEELCLLETAFPCASAEYFQADQECRLSRESRR